MLVLTYSRLKQIKRKNYQYQYQYFILLNNYTKIGILTQLINTFIFSYALHTYFIFYIQSNNLFTTVTVLLGLFNKAPQSNTVPLKPNKLYILYIHVHIYYLYRALQKYSYHMESYI